MQPISLLSRRLTSLDASFLYLERPNAPLHVGAVYTFARPLDHERLCAYVSERLPAIPRYRQRVVTVPLHLGHPRWEPDPDFDIRRHVACHQLTTGHGDRALAALCARLFAEPLDRRLPLWEMHLVDGVGTGCAILAKTHHCMIDGASGVELTNVLMTTTPRASRLDPAPPQSPAAPPSGAVGVLIDSLLESLAGQLRAARQLARGARRPARLLSGLRADLAAAGTVTRLLLSPVTPAPFDGPLSSARAVAWVPLSFHEVRAVKNRLGGTVNDVVLTVIAGALRDYLHRHGAGTRTLELKTMVPGNVRAAHEQQRPGDRVSMLVAPLPVGVADPVQRLRHISAAMEILKNSGQAAQFDRLGALSELLPALLHWSLGRVLPPLAPVNTVCTNVPGPRETRYLLGEPVQLMVPLVPLAGSVGLAFATMSYADHLTVGLTADGERVRDLAAVAAALQRSFEDLWAAAGLQRVTHAPTLLPERQRRQRAAAATAHRSRCH